MSCPDKARTGKRYGPARRVWELTARLLLPLLLCALSLAAPGTAAALAPDKPAAGSPDVPLYEVEMVVFSAVSIGAAEDWNSAPAGRGFGGGNHSAEVPEVVRVLGPADYRLDGVVGGLRASGAWRLIAHAAWIQTAPSWGTHIGVPLSQIGVQVPGLSGSVYLERAPLYLHLGFDISLQNGATYKISEMRNVRQNEKQYFDHPAFGIVAMVTPIKGGA